jgi:L-lactate dehydrogenase
MQKITSKVSIIGGGNVGIRYAYALLIKGLAREIAIVDIDRKRVEGEVMDLSHGAPFYAPVNISASSYPNIVGSDLVVITAGSNQKPEQTRLDLVKNNVQLFKKIIPDIVKYAPTAIYLIVTNPVDILSYVAYKIAHKLIKKPANEIIGSGTVLDSARFRYIIGVQYKVDPANVHGYILGEHGDSEFAAWSGVSIGGALINDYFPADDNQEFQDHHLNLNEIFEQVKNSAYEIIDRKGETSYGIGIALARITQAILNDENSILPVSSLIDNYLDIDDVYLSLPVILNRNGVRELIYLELNPEEQVSLKDSVSTIKNVLNQLDLN